MKKIAFFLLGALLVFSQTGPTLAASPPQDDQEAIEIILQINAYRAENDLYPYAYNLTLVGTAQAHSEYQASINELTHDGAGGTSSSERIGAAGYGGENAILVNEMIYSGQYATPETAMAFWKGSPIHNAIMLSEYHEIGVGIAQSETHIFYTVNVASITGVTSPSPMGELVPGYQPGAAPPEPPAAGEPTTDAPLSPSAILSNQLMMILVGVVILFVTGYLLVKQFRSPAAPDEEFYEDYEDDEFLPPVAGSRELSRQEHLAALQILAGNALSAYALEVIDVEPFRYALNTEFLVVAHPPLGGPPRRYILRINAPGYHTKDEIRSEMEWLRALNEETALLVPRPIPTRKREWVTMAEGPNLPEPRFCALFDFIPGKTIKGAITPKQLEKVGSFIAALHQHGHRYNPSQDFTRKHWDYAGLTGKLLDTPVERAYAAFNENEMAVIMRAEKMVEEATDQLGKTDEVYGLIHADLHEKSYHFQEDKVYILDFDTCGYGYYIYDLAVPVRNLVHQEEYIALKKALFRGYRRIRPLSIPEERLLKHFVAGRLLIHTLMLAANRNHPAFKDRVDEVITLQIRMLKSVVSSIMR
jgi:Ser/Thr protein kinase RdoA (MazF antagonist)/uncharacterized protein YkwD